MDEHRSAVGGFPSTTPDPGDDSAVPELVGAIRAAIAAGGGRISFARFMALALYHPVYGYYLAAERRPGRGGDFLTAPETHPFFGLTVARQLAEWWERLGRPRPFTVREYGAGVGGLAYDLIAGLHDANPEAAAALRYRLVEPNPYRRAQALAAMAEVGLADVVVAEGASLEEGHPPRALELGSHPDPELEPIVGVVLANEVADALPVHRLVWRGAATGDALRERWVTWGGDGFADQEGELSAEVAAFDPAGRLARAGVSLADGDAVEASPATAAWFAAAARGLERGYALVIDYGYDTAELYRAHRLGGTLRAYHRHTVSDNPYRRVGAQDLTAHVDFGTLRQAGEAAGLRFVGLTNQADFLTALGLGERLLALQAEPGATAEDYLASRATLFRLINPSGMGRFRVLAMARDAPTEPPPRGFPRP